MVICYSKFFFLVNDLALRMNTENKLKSFANVYMLNTFKRPFLVFNSFHQFSFFSWTLPKNVLDNDLEVEEARQVFQQKLSSCPSSPYL